MRPGTFQKEWELEFFRMSRPRGIAMNASERFLKFAAECEAMAKFSHSRENKTVWRELAERWLRIADFVERQNTLANSVGRPKQHRKRLHSWAH